MSLQITRPALTAIKRTLEKMNPPPGQLFRLICDSQNNMDFVLDKPKEEDQIIALDEEPLLVIEPDLNRILSRFTLDVQEEGEETTWVLKKKANRRDPENGNP